MAKLFEIKCSECGETCFTSMEERIGTKHRAKFDDKGNFVMCPGEWERVPEADENKAVKAVVEGMVE